MPVDSILSGDIEPEASSVPSLSRSVQSSVESISTVWNPPPSWASSVWRLALRTSAPYCIGFTHECTLLHIARNERALPNLIDLQEDR